MIILKRKNRLHNATKNLVAKTNDLELIESNLRIDGMIDIDGRLFG